MEQRKAEHRLEGCQGSVEGVILVNGRPKIERADMPLTFSFDSIEDLERFCEVAKGKGRELH